VDYIEVAELARLLPAAITDKNIAIIDVRNSDFEGGHIPSAVNIPYGDEWENDKFLDGVISSIGYKAKAVFHCMKSQVRGPYCAKQVARRLEALNLESKPEM
jgi:Cdc25 family phosphatase